ncbi:iron ABC transporter permease [bacterium]|nr:iron ABC transporter permease [bacterium]
MNKKVFFIFVVICFVVIGILPILFMLAKSVNVDGRFSLFFYKNFMNSRREWTLIGNSFTLSFLTALFTTIIGLPLGILFAKTNLPLKKLFTIIFTIPLLIPPYITAISWFDLLGREGLLSKFLNPATAEITSKWLFGLPGCVLILFSTFLPIVILLTITFLKTINPRLEEAGKLVSGWPGVLKSITIPLIMPGLLLASILVFLLTLGEFGVPTFLRYDVFPVESFTQFAAFYNFGAATAAAAPLVIITLIVLVIERIFLREKTYQLHPAVGGDKSSKINLGIYRKWLFIIVTLLCFCSIILPFLVLLFHSFSAGVYKEALSRAGDSLFRSVAYAAIGASALAVLGFFLGYLIHSKTFRFWRAVDSLTIFLFALSGTIIGIGLINLWNRPATNFIYATPVIIIFGYLAQYTALTSRITVSTLAQIPSSMEEAAQVSGAKWMRRITLITAPMVKRGLIAGWLVGYIFCLRDMGVTMLVYPPGHDTFPVRIFTLMANGSTELIAALCVIMIIATLLPLGIGGILFKLRGFIK